MNKHLLYILGTTLLLFSGLLYTLERITVYLAEHIDLASYRTGNINGALPVPHMGNGFENPYVILFLLLGISFYVFGYLSKK